MILTDDQLKEIEELSGLFLSPREIAILMDLDGDWFAETIQSCSGLAYQAYFKGKTLSKKMIHENVIKMAKHGSPQAEELARDMIVQQKIEEKRAKR